MNDIQINQDIIKRFVKLIKNNRLAHAYLFVGAADIGKKQTALAVSKLLNCENKKNDLFCDGCPSCLKINSGNNPDIHITSKEITETIKIEDVRGILEQVKLRPFCSFKKVFIITNVQNFTHEAANALLKTLEEPNGNSLLILTTSFLSKVLGTIRSRCHIMYFSTVSNEKLASELSKHYEKDHKDNHFISYFSEGCFGKAKKLKEANLFQRKNEIIDNFILSDNSEALKDIVDNKDKAATKEFLNIILSWVRDAILIKSGISTDKIINSDKLMELTMFQDQYSFSELKEFYDEIINMCKLLAENLNIKIPLLIIKEKLWAR